MASDEAVDLSKCICHHSGRRFRKGAPILYAYETRLVNSNREYYPYIKVGIEKDTSLKGFFARYGTAYPDLDKRLLFYAELDEASKIETYLKRKWKMKRFVSSFGAKRGTRDGRSEHYRISLYRLKKEIKRYYTTEGIPVPADIDIQLEDAAYLCCGMYGELVGSNDREVSDPFTPNEYPPDDSSSSC